MPLSSSTLTVGLLTGDIEHSQRFYQHILDARYEGSDGNTRQLSVAGQSLNLIQRVNGNLSGNAGSVQLQFRVPFTATEMLRRARDFGIETETAAENIYRIKDPDGNEVVLHTKRERVYCEDDACPWSASLFHVLVAHRPTMPTSQEEESWN